MDDLLISAAPFSRELADETPARMVGVDWSRLVLWDTAWKKATGILQVSPCDLKGLYRTGTDKLRLRSSMSLTR